MGPKTVTITASSQDEGDSSHTKEGLSMKANEDQHPASLSLRKSYRKMMLLALFKLVQYLLFLITAMKGKMRGRMKRRSILHARIARGNFLLSKA
jgi:hypothetical protein